MNGLLRLGVVLAAVLPLARPCKAEDVAPVQLPSGAGALADSFLSDPGRVRAMLEAERHGTQLPAPMLLLLGDAQTRRGRWGEAQRLFRLALDRDPNGQWAGFARLGLGWMALARGDLAEARAEYANAADSSGFARVALAIIDAADRRAGAADTLRAFAADPGLSASLQQVARIMVGYAEYWRGDDHAAVETFEAVTDGRFADDAAYAAARARWRRGDQTGALEAWRALAGATDAPHARVSRRVLELEPISVLRAGLQRYRKLPTASQDEQLAAMLDADGVLLASASIDRTEQPEASPPAPSLPAPAVVAEPREATIVAPDAPAHEERARAESRRPSSGRSWVDLLLILAVIAVPIVLWWRVPARRVGVPR